jgi:predicted metal-binding protein
MITGKVVPFKHNEGLSPALLSHLREKGKAYNLEAVIPFNTREIIVADWVHLKCRYGCSQYNSSWCCPPATPDPERSRTIISEYNEALLLIGTQRCPEFYMNNASKRLKQVKFWKGTVSLERLLFLDGYYKAFSLVGESCALCKECAYPNECWFPQERRPSVESFSIDVIGTLNRLGISPRVAKHRMESFSYYGIILVE